MEITSLNDDCLRLIFECCPFESQISLLKTCERFKVILQDILQKSWKELDLEFPALYNRINMPDGTMYKISNEDLELLLESIHKSVQIFKLGGATAQKFDLIQKYSFPKAKELHVCVNELSATFDGSLYTFPSLRIFAIKGYECIRLDQQWHNIQVLDLTHSVSSPDNLWEIISPMKLKTLILNTLYKEYPPQVRDFQFLSELEELSVNCDEVIPIQNALGIMRKLKKLTMFRSIHYADISDLKIILSSLPGLRVVEFIACRPINDNFNFFKYVSAHVKELPHLRKLTVVGSNVDCVEFAKKFPMLREFTLVHSKINGETLHEFLKIGKQVKLLQLYQCIVWPTTFNVSEISARRSMPITINIVDKRQYRYGEIDLSAPTELIKITENPVELHHDDVLYELILEPF